MMQTTRALALCLAVGVVAACGDDAKEMTEAVAPSAGANNPMATPDGAAPPAEPGSVQPGAPAQYALVSRVTTPTGASTVVAAINSLAAGSVDVKRGLEIGGQAAAHGSPMLPGKVFVASAERPEVARYEVSPEGAFTLRGMFSLATYGLTKAPRTFVFASPELAYAISAETYQVFVWNPSMMLVDRVITLPDRLKREGHTPAWVFRAAIRNNQLIIPITWVKQGADPGAAPQSALALVDTTNDQVTVLEEPRCGGLRSVFAAGEGDVWFASTAGAPATWNRMYGERGGSEPCIVRLRPGENVIDASFIARPKDIAQGRLAVDFAPAGRSHLVFQALDEQLFPLTPTSKPEEAWNAAAWRYFSVSATLLNEGAAPAQLQELAVPPSALNALRFEVDDRDFVPRIEADYSKTTLIDVSQPQQVTEGPTIVGSVGNLFRLR